jgi:hypothetical protein
MLNAGMICVPAHAPWLPALEAEMRSFPNGAHDDMCDVASMSCNDSLDIQMGEAPIKMPDDERILMDTEHKAELVRRIERMRSQTGDCTEEHDW